jgi:preprotein translocase subunit YajC
VDIVTLLPLLLLGAVFYFLIIRPQRTRQRQQTELISSVRPNAQIMTSSGIFGRVTERDEEFVRVEIAPGVVVTLLPAAIAKIIDPGPEAFIVEE